MINISNSTIAMPIGTTLDRFINSLDDNSISGLADVGRLLKDIALASKVVNREINKAGLVDIIGNYGYQNSGGEEQQKLDILADIRFTRAIAKGGKAAGIISEEQNDFIDFKNKGECIVAIDPLDGSSNIDVNISVGTIFSIFRRITPKGTPLTTDDFLQQGKKQIAAGYILYGTSTMLVFSLGKGVHAFTLDLSLGEYFLSLSNLKTILDGQIYSLNEGLTNHINDQKLVEYIQYCKLKKFNLRYVGSLVADFHRNLIKGGIYIYPSTKDMPNGKLRLLFECNALAFISEQAGGLGSDGRNRILEITPTEIHQRSPFYVGSFNMIKQIEDKK